jgi:hypothetical protein
MSTILSILGFITLQLILFKFVLGRPEPARDVQSEQEKDFSWISAPRSGRHP